MTYVQPLMAAVIVLALAAVVRQRSGKGRVLGIAEERSSCHSPRQGRV